MTFPTRFTIGWHQYSEGSPDAHNNPTAVYTPALNVAGAQLKVIGFATNVNDEGAENRTVARRKMFAPPDCPIRAMDVVDIGSEQWEVDGPVDDQSSGFHGWRPGVVVWLKRVQR